jgi:hypothetical protein
VEKLVRTAVVEAEVVVFEGKSLSGGGGVEEGERVLVVRITPGPRMAVASVLRESKLFCETPMQVSLGVFFTN